MSVREDVNLTVMERLFVRPDLYCLGSFHVHDFDLGFYVRGWKIYPPGRNGTNQLNQPALARKYQPHVIIHTYLSYFTYPKFSFLWPYLWSSR